MAELEERKQMEIITNLSNQAVQEYEGLQSEHERATMECKRMQEERDEAVNKLKEFQRVSHMVIEEVNTIQEDLEIERTCRQSVEALATKLNLQNRSLKRKSMLLLSHLGPETITEINLEDEEEEEEEEPDTQTGSKGCSSTPCQATITELRNKLELTLEEKSQVTNDLEATREQVRVLREELLKEKHDNIFLIGETVQQKKLLSKYNRVSLFAVEEYEALQENLDLERDLRAEAENFAREMIVEQKKLNRQSQILLQSASPSEVLQSALSEVTRLTQVLETQRLEHQQQMKLIEDQLRGSVLQKEMVTLQRKLELLEDEKQDHEDRCSKAEVEAKDLRFMVEELQKRLQVASNPPPAPAHLPPPPPPPPPPPAPLSNPLSSLLSMIRKKRDINHGIPLVVQNSVKEPETDIRQQAVDEMMQRIKKGVHLRPVSQSANRTKHLQRERMPSNSAIQELKGILDSFQRPSPQLNAGTLSTNTESELERVLLRRRGAFQTPQDS